MVRTPWLSPETVFAFLLNASGATILMVYLMIALSQIKLRSSMSRDEVAQLKLKMWWFPTLSVLAAAGIVGVLVSMFYVESSRSQISLSVAALILALVAYQIRRRINPENPLAHNISDPAPHTITESSPR